ncbi:MAG: hypothetical protein QOC96_1006 [Acidobacteriota bacterium]|nr:hypothetical protein [Acidobacteriota bacterium]
MGQLNEHPLAELIREISAAELSGALRLFRDRAKAVIYFESGQIIYAASNLRAYRLSVCLSRWGIFNEEQLARVQNQTSDAEFGVALVKAGMLNREKLNELIVHQVSEIICHTLLWIDGEWEFDPRVRLSEEAVVSLKMPELLMESARRLPVGFVASRFRNSNEKIIPAADASPNTALLPTEAFVLTRVDMPLRVHELLAVGGLPENETLHTIYTLALGGFLQREQWPQAFTAQEISKARSVKSSSIPKPEKIKPELESKPTPPIAAPAPKEVRDEQAELAEMFARLKMAANYYQVLGVTRPANDADIKRAYHSLAKRFHPDRFRNTVDSKLYTRIESAFAKIAQAYETLKEKRSRASYESTLLMQGVKPGASDTPRESSQTRTNSPQNTNPTNYQDGAASSQTGTPSSSYNAEERFQQGLNALQSGNLTQAIVYLGEAAQLAPSQPRYRAYYGRALAGDERMRRNAEAEFKAAITLDANNASFRVMLAEFYSEQGFLRRAQAELERALSIEPRNETARRLLGKLKG